jgi:hypothetical protein
MLSIEIFVINERKLTTIYSEKMLKREKKIPLMTFRGSCRLYSTLNRISSIIPVIIVAEVDNGRK